MLQVNLLDSTFLYLIIHNKNQLKPGDDGMAGSKSMIYIPDKVHKNGTRLTRKVELSRRKIELLPTEHNPCNVSNENNFLDCVYDFVDKEAGCSSKVGTTKGIKI